MNINPLDVSFEPLAGSTLINLLRLLAQNRFKIDSIGFPRLVYSFLLSMALSPLNIYERIKFDKKINNTNISKPPVFIIGHWRSGTTYLHNLMAQDKNFIYPTTFQTITPGLFLGSEKLVKPIVKSSLPPKRPQDDVDLDCDYPNEEEYGIGNLSPYSFYNGWCFPKNMEYYNKFVLMEGVSKETIEKWKKIYLYFLKKVYLNSNGQQLLLKNPSNTSRIKILLELFPDAKFIHIYRNPYHVFLSMKRNIEKEMTLYCLQNPKNEELIEKTMVKLYNKMFKKYYEEKKIIKKSNLCEVKYEEFLEKPLNELERIYNQIEIPNFDIKKEIFKNYIDSQSTIKIHNYEHHREKKDLIYGYLKHTIDLWGYLF
jgi:hypothetical protein